MAGGTAPTCTNYDIFTTRVMHYRQRSTMAMASINKLLVAASAVVATMILTSPLCISLSIPHSLKRWRQHPHQRQGTSCTTRRVIAPLVCSMIHTADDERETGPTTRRRWRRRRKIDDAIASSIISNRNDGRVAGVDDDDDDDESRFSWRDENEQPSSNCPIYSMKFPRYRISLTHDSSKNLESEKRRMRRLKRGFITKLVAQSSASSSSYGGSFDNNHRNFVNKARNGDNGNNNHPLGIMSSILRVWNPSTELLNPLSRNDWRARQTVESFYQKEMMHGRFRWITSSSSFSDSGKNTTVPSSTIINAPDEDFYAAASFWRMASDITARLASQDSDDIDDDDHQQQKMWYLALPETTSTVAQNLCDTLNWYADYTVEQNKNDAGKKLPLLPPLLHAEIDTRVNNGKIPIVRFTLHCQAPWQQRQERRQEQLAQEQQQQNLLLPTPDDTERRTKAWVRRVLVNLGICPFTKSDIKSGQGLRDLGVPVANIMYRHSSAIMGSFGCGRSREDVYLLMADTWEAISDMVAAGPTNVSSILLSAPGFDEDFEFFAGPIFAMLETCVSAIQAEEMIGVVCFHPKYVTPDGTSWPGFGHMHSAPRLKQWYNEYTATFPSSSLPGNESTLVSQPLSDNVIAAGGAWQRRTPHSVINVLRSEQLEAAEGRRRTGELYGRNIRVLVGSEGGVGLEKLTEDLKREQCM